MRERRKRGEEGGETHRVATRNCPSVTVSIEAKKALLHGYGKGQSRSIIMSGRPLALTARDSAWCVSFCCTNGAKYRMNRRMTLQGKRGGREQPGPARSSSRDSEGEGGGGRTRTQRRLLRGTKPPR